MSLEGRLSSWPVISLCVVYLYTSQHTNKSTLLFLKRTYEERVFVVVVVVLKDQ